MPRPGQVRHKARNERVGAGPADIRRLARRAGVKRLSGLVDAPFIDQILRTGLLTDTINRAVHVAGRRKTVSLPDVMYALRVGGRPVWGVVPPERVRPPGPTWNALVNRVIRAVEAAAIAALPAPPAPPAAPADPAAVAAAANAAANAANAADCPRLIGVAAEAVEIMRRRRRENTGLGWVARLSSLSSAAGPVAHLAARLVLDRAPPDAVRWLAGWIFRAIRGSPALAARWAELAQTFGPLTASDCVAFDPRGPTFKFANGVAARYKAEDQADAEPPKIIVFRCTGDDAPLGLVVKPFAAERNDIRRCVRATAKFLREADAIQAFRAWAADYPAARAVVVAASPIGGDWDAGRLAGWRSPGIVVMTRQLHTLDRPTDNWTWADSLRCFSGLVAAIDALGATQFWDLKNDNVTASVDGSVQLIDLDGVMTPELIARRMRDERRDADNAVSPFITTTRPPGLTDEVVARWGLQQPPRGFRYWAADPDDLDLAGQLACYRYVAAWCIVQSGFELMNHVGRHARRSHSPLVKAGQEGDIPIVPVDLAADRMRVLFAATQPTPGDGAVLHAACLALLDSAVRLLDGADGTFAELAGLPAAPAGLPAAPAEA
jgi:histone H3/H4